MRSSLVRDTLATRRDACGILAPGGRYAIHELGFRPDDVPEEVVAEVSRRVRGRELMPWQAYFADVLCEIDPDHPGEWWYKKAVVCVPRQAGKSDVIGAVHTHRLLAFADHRAVLTAPTRKDAGERPRPHAGGRAGGQEKELRHRPGGLGGPDGGLDRGALLDRVPRPRPGPPPPPPGIPPRPGRRRRRSVLGRGLGVPSGHRPHPVPPAPPRPGIRPAPRRMAGGGPETAHRCCPWRCRRR